MNIRDDCQSVICHLHETEKKKAILEVIDSCSIFHSLSDVERFKRGVLRRERIETTGIGHGVAIAHGKIIGLKSVKIALGLSPEGIDFEAKDGLPVHLLFVIASSPSIQIEYLRALSAILQSVRTEQVREHLLSLNDFECDERCVNFFKMMASQHFIWLCKNQKNQ
ncbi:PTS sugar transporter subunit IIA [uncultured Sphaerochaeta sp.]|uniref:PTS sugar transporter subunit IIA n=1 Tax=uncultured Sphaerochaeta sp. TaxID=886478 RepID=UPI002A0A8E47|nr:PTS sugar transporter subunit IIA [uncultured Sphaerochaeta sp.]